MKKFSNLKYETIFYYDYREKLFELVNNNNRIAIIIKNVTAVR